METNNPTPQVGQIIYSEQLADDGQLKIASLRFVDEEPGGGQMWNYTELAMMEDYGDGEGPQVYSNMTAGRMPPEYTRLATDEDLAKFVEAYRQGKTQDPEQTLEVWLDMVKGDDYLLQEEKDRIVGLAA